MVVVRALALKKKIVRGVEPVESVVEVEIGVDYDLPVIDFHTPNDTRRYG